MRRRMRKLVGWFVLAGLAWALPANLQAQNNYPVPPVDFTGPLSHPRYETGGFFVSLEGLWMRQNRPLANQDVAFRGFIDTNGSISGQAGRLVGSGDTALNTQQLRGPGSYQPGFNLTAGWLFENEVCVQLSWWHLANSRYSATAGPVPPGFDFGVALGETFISAPVFNFPLDYAGNPQNVGAGTPGATFGIWNAASLMTIDFIQRFDMVELTGRIPVYSYDNQRMYGLIGPRAITMWERFRWRTVDTSVTGVDSPFTTAIYSNVTSNRLYGVHLGCGYDWHLGSTPVGSFAVTLEAEGAIYLDFVKGRAKYELADRSTAATRARNLWSMAPGVEAELKLWWYPWEAVQLEVGYSWMAFFNTVSSERPIDFNFGAIDPEWEHGAFRFLHGLHFGIGFVF